VKTVKVLRSRITGELQTYVLGLYQSPDLEPFEEWDMDAEKERIQSELDAKGIDAIVDKVEHWRTPAADYLVVYNWVPVETVEASRETKLIHPLLASLFQALIEHITAVLFVVALGIIALMVFWFTHPQQATYYQHDPETGEVKGGLTYTEYISLKRAEYPNCFICPYCGQVFCPEDYGGDVEAAREAWERHVASCPAKELTAGWEQEAMPNWLDVLIYGGIAVVGLLFLSQVIGAFGGVKK